MRAVWIAVTNTFLILVLLVLPFRANAEGIKTGEEVTAFVALCSTRSEADTLLSKLRDGGKEGAIAWMRDPDNTCLLDMFTFIVGETVGNPVRADNKDWTVFTVHPVTGNATHYGVVPLAVFEQVSL